METRILGSSGIRVSAIGLGCWGMSGAYGESDRNESIKTIHESVHQGINLIDTADIYGNGHNEDLVGEAIRDFRHKVILATKFGFVGKENDNLAVNGSPGYVVKACEASLKRLNTDYIDLYYLHRLDKNVPVEDTVGAMSRLVEQGKVRYLGLSEISAATLERALKVHPVTALQSEYSLNTRDIEKEILPSCRKNNVALVAFSPLGRALLTCRVKHDDDLPDNDFRRNIPRFQGENLSRNLILLNVLEKMAVRKNITPAQLALGWLLNRGNDIIPIPGMKRTKYVSENIASVNVKLSPEEINELDVIYENISGERYNNRSSKYID